MSFVFVEEFVYRNKHQPEVERELQSYVIRPTPVHMSYYYEMRAS